MKKIKSGILCRVISGNAGPKSPNSGRVVKVVEAHPNPKPHTLWGQIWRCQANDGLPFIILRDNVEIYGTGHAEAMIADFAEDWLEPIMEDKLPPKAVNRETELTS